MLCSTLDEIKECKSDHHRTADLAKALLTEISTVYWEQLLVQIRETVADAREKKRIARLARILASEVELQGISREYLFTTTKEFFFNTAARPKKIDSLDLVQDFLQQLEVECADWKVYLRGSATFLDFQEQSSRFGVEICDALKELKGLNKKGRQFLETTSEHPIYIVVDVRAVREQYSAARRARDTLNVFTDVCKYIDHTRSLLWTDLCLAVNQSNNSISMVPKQPNPMECCVELPEDDAKSGVERCIALLASRELLSAHSRSVLRSAYDYHRVALEANRPENQLLDLWAALEGFLPPPVESVARIAYFSDLLIPALTLTYAARILGYLSMSMFTAGESVVELVESCGHGSSFLDKCSAITLCEDLQEFRDRLYQELGAHVLLRNRVFLVNEMFGTKSRCAKSLKNHRTRLQWHLQRIYVARNQIAHSARALPYLPILVENLHSYVDRLLNSISTLAELHRVTLSVGTAVQMLKTHERAYLGSLSPGEEVVTTANFKRIVFGAANPLVPK